MIEVLNGFVDVGDVICYAVKESCIAQMKIARVIDITEVREYSWDDVMIPALRVRVFGGTDIKWTGEYNTTIRKINRVVKIHG